MTNPPAQPLKTKARTRDMAWFSVTPHVYRQQAVEVAVTARTLAARIRRAYRTESLKETTLLTELCEAVRREVVDWDSQVADPKAALHCCTDTLHIAEYRRILTALGRL
jgi:hypothetical protein